MDIEEMALGFARIYFLQNILRANHIFTTTATNLAF